ncbi:hypothetical protein BDZ94DRAFT_1254739 [Collybia nuda]|uniref:F-box domain-containing protein n=1 Tax=Collybia nuda TaxID=64659 RepID=A0A9P5Y7U8_9AGAR|nr:hypothetical protein BDZ94DRAFT_1254739 [Collybia nuda]
MHPCLSVQEILWIIFDSLLNDAPSRENKGTVISLAITCRTFENMALDVLWRTQVNLVPLIKCMPADLWKEDPAYGFDRYMGLNRDLVASDFLRFDFYAQRIINLKYLPYGCHQRAKVPYDLAICHTIQRYLEQHGEAERQKSGLLPNLRRMEFSNSLHALVAPKLFLGEQTTAFSLGFRDECGEVEIKLLFALIRKQAPNVENLEICVGGAESLLECPDLSELVRGLEGLRGLTTRPRSLNASAIRHLASIPYLHFLRSPNSATQILQALALVASHPFKSMRHLEMSGASLSTWPALLMRLRPHQLVSVALDFEALPSGLDIQRFFLALKETSASPGLRALRLNQPWKPQSARVSTQIILDFGILEPLLAFNNLQTLHIALVCAITLDDSHITQMAKSWPKLQNLQLGCHLGWEKPSSITHRGLLAVAASCPELETLTISFDASELRDISPVIIPEAVNTKVKYLSVGDSRIVESAGVARFLSLVFPKVVGIGGAWLYISAGAFTQPQRRQHQMWQDVPELLQKSQRVATPFTGSRISGSVGV